MANLSNINNFFVVEQTTGYVGIGITDPAFPLEVKSASAELALNATGASIYRLKSDSTDYFRINKNGVGDRLVISGAGNVGIGTDSTEGKLTIQHTSANPPTSGTTANSAIQILSNLSPPHQLNIGVVNAPSYGSYIQASDNNLAVNYTLLLQPNGGNVGIGTYSASAKLEVVTAVGADAIRLNYGQSADIFLGFNSANPRILLQDNSNVVTHNFQSNGDNYIVGSDVGIGTTTPERKLDVKSNSDTAPSAYLRGGKSSQGEIQNTGLIIGTQTTMVAGDYQGISFTGYTSASAIARGRAAIGVEAINGPGKMDLIFMTRFADDGTQLSSADEKMRITSGGNVGIGTDSPTGYKLVIQNTAEDMIKLHNSTDGLDSLISFTNPGGTLARIQGLDNGGLQFDTGNNAGGLNTNVMYMSNSGNVGIGTNLPGATLDVVNSGNYESIRIGNSQLANVNKQGGITALNYTGDSTSIFQYATNSSGNTVYFGSADGSFRGTTQLSFMISSSAASVSHSQMLRINAASINAYLDQYIIKTTPTIILEGRNSGNSGAKLQFLGWANTHDNWELGNAMAGQGFQFRASATAGSTNFATVAVINSNTGVYTATSDINKKKDFEDSKIGLNEVMKLKPKLFRMKTENENLDKHLGFIAQEVKEVIPQAYLEENGKDNTKFIGIQDRPIIAALTKAIQELKAEIELLKSK